MIPVLTQPCMEMSGYEPIGVICVESKYHDSYAARLESVKEKLAEKTPDATIFFNLQSEDRRSQGGYLYLRATADAYKAK